MPTSIRAISDVRRFAERGFTLVELMVVVVILAIASAAVVMSIPDPAGRVTDDAERFAAAPLPLATRRSSKRRR